MLDNAVLLASAKCRSESDGGFSLQTPMSLLIAKADHESLRRQAEQAYPEECCGILLGSTTAGERHVRTIVPCRNTRVGDAHKRFEIDPAELVRVQREARESGTKILGFYHSHPDHPPQPSPTDLEHAHWIGCSYVIVGVAQGKATETRSFLLTGTREEDKRFVEEALLVDGYSRVESQPDS